MALAKSLFFKQKSKLKKLFQKIVFRIKCQILPEKCIDSYILKEKENLYLMEFGGIATGVS